MYICLKNYNFWKRKFHYSVHKSQPLSSFPRQWNLVHILTPDSLRMIFNLSVSSFPQVSHAFRVLAQDKMEMIYWKNLVLVDGAWVSYIILLLPSCVHIWMFTHGWRVWLYDSSRRDDRFHAPNCLLCGDPKGLVPHKLVNYLLQLHQGIRTTILVTEIIWTCRENIWT